MLTYDEAAAMVAAVVHELHHAGRTVLKTYVVPGAPAAHVIWLQVHEKLHAGVAFDGRVWKLTAHPAGRDPLDDEHLADHDATSAAVARRAQAVLAEFEEAYPGLYPAVAPAGADFQGMTVDEIQVLSWDTARLNTSRAVAAFGAVSHHAFESGTCDTENVRTAVGDLLVNLYHLADAAEIDLDLLVRNAWSAYREDLRDH